MKSVDDRFLWSVETIVGALLLSFPALMVTFLGGMNAVLFASVLIALLVKFRSPAKLDKAECKSEWLPYMAAMFAMTIAILISQTYHQSFSAPHYDGPARYWLAIPVFLLFYRLDLRIFSTLQFAFPIAAIIGWILANDQGGGMTMPQIDKIRYGDSMLIFSALSLFSLDWLGRDARSLRALKWTGFFVGLIASFQSGTRGALLAIPVFVAIYIYSRGGRLSIKTILVSLISGAMIIGISYLSSPKVQFRLEAISSDVTAYDQGNRNTSTGIRWQLYHAAVEIISEQPVFGVGPGGYALQMASMANAGKITQLAAELGRGEVHNDILKKTADMGIFGLIAIFSVYLVPFWMFLKSSKSYSMRIRRAGVMGMVFVSGFMVFGLTAEVLNLTMTISFYSFTVAVLLAYCYNIHHAEQGAT